MLVAVQRLHHSLARSVSRVGSAALLALAFPDVGRLRHLLLQRQADVALLGAVGGVVAVLVARLRVDPAVLQRGVRGQDL